MNDWKKGGLIVVNILIVIIKFYQILLSSILISPLIGNRCRFYPSCSEYFIKSLEYNGLIKGCLRGVKRILKCHPFNTGGYDPVNPHQL